MLVDCSKVMNYGLIFDELVRRRQSDVRDSVRKFGMQLLKEDEFSFDRLGGRERFNNQLLVPMSGHDSLRHQGSFAHSMPKDVLVYSFPGGTKTKRKQHAHLTVERGKFEVDGRFHITVDFASSGGDGEPRGAAVTVVPLYRYDRVCSETYRFTGESSAPVRDGHRELCGLGASQRSGIIIPLVVAFDEYLWFLLDRPALISRSRNSTLLAEAFPDSMPRSNVAAWVPPAVAAALQKQQQRATTSPWVPPAVAAIQARRRGQEGGGRSSSSTLKTTRRRRK